MADALADPTLTMRFMALWATQMAMGANAFGQTLGREVTAEDIEPVNWVQVEHARRLTAVDLATAQAEMYAFRRRLQQWWADGWDVLVTPTLAEPPPPLAEFEPVEGEPTAQMRRAGQWVAFTRAYNMSGQPANSLPLHWNADGLPIGVQTVAAYGRRGRAAPRRLAAGVGTLLVRSPSSSDQKSGELFGSPDTSVGG